VLGQEPSMAHGVEASDSKGFPIKPSSIVWILVHMRVDETRGESKLKMA